MSQNFLETHEFSGRNVKVELDLSNYAKKVYLKGETGIDTSMLLWKTNLASMRTKIDNLDVDKLKTVPADLSKLCNVIDNNVAKKLYMINWISKSMLLMLRYQILMD